MRPVQLLPLHRPESFAASLRARWVQAEEFRLHYRSVSEPDALPAPTAGIACAVGFVLPKRQCRHAARRNLIRRIAREVLREQLQQLQQTSQPVPGGEGAPGAGPAPLPAFVFRLHSRLGPQWVSAQSPALRRYLRATLAQLLQQGLRQWQRAAVSVSAGRP